MIRQRQQLKPLFSRRMPQKCPLLATLLAILLLPLTGCNELQTSTTSTSSQKYHHQVEPHRLKAQSGYYVERKFAGTVRSRQSARLMFEVSGRVDSVLAFEGDKVKQGQILATLDQELLTIELQQLSAQQAQFKAQQALTQANLRRVNALIEQGYTSAQSKDELIAEMQVLNANLQQVQANIDAKHYQLKRTAITAPFAGTINKRLINKGELVSPQTMAFELQQGEQNELKVGVPQHLVGAIAEQTHHQLLIDEAKIDVDNVSINSDINPLSRTVQLRFRLPDTLAVYNNQLGYLDYQQYIKADGFWVPLSAITDGVRGVWNVYILSRGEQDLFTIQPQTVEILYVTQDSAYIRGQLDNDALIVKSGLQRLVSGQLVRVKELVSAP
ncbi:efflux RND transporter periplasmic adaptor subunit [Thalassotalea mangrovi]|nr:efflux RND transporter periplasmic adaptor subunit [Thalassotalea mangrovi]